MVTDAPVYYTKDGLHIHIVTMITFASFARCPMGIRTRSVSIISFRLPFNFNPFAPLFAEGRIPEEDTEVYSQLLILPPCTEPGC